MFEIIFIGIFLALLLVFIYLWIVEKEKVSDYTDRFSTVVDVDKECEKVRKETSKECDKLRRETQKEVDKLRREAVNERDSLQREMEKLRQDAQTAVTSSLAEQAEIKQENEAIKEKYRNNKATLQKLLEQVAIYNEELESIDLGLYQPHFDFETSERFKEQIQYCRDRQKALIKSDQAIYCHAEWTVEGSRAKGKQMTDRAVRLTARAFNNECDAAVSNVTWKNARRMEERIIKAYEVIHKLNESSKVEISREYLDLKLQELRLTHEYREKRQAEKEEQAEIRRQMREEAKLEKELEKSIREEERYQRLLKKAQEEAAIATGERLDALTAKISELSQDLEQAHSMSQRAKSMAEQTKRGHVYVISNIGSFGDRVYKIGMTRRLEPLDRVKELGDASVPFNFDVHAMIYSEDAPGLEAELHRKFEESRLNLVNTRREFFSTSLEEIEEVALEISPDCEFITTPEAREYRESMLIRKKREQKKEEPATVAEALPDDLD